VSNQMMDVDGQTESDERLSRPPAKLQISAENNMCIRRVCCMLFARNDDFARSRNRTSSTCLSNVSWM